MHCTLPRGPSRSARLAITSRLSPRIMRLDQFWSCWYTTLRYILHPRPPVEEGVSPQVLRVILQDQAPPSHSLHQSLQGREPAIGHRLVHQGPHPLQRLPLRAVGGQKDQTYPCRYLHLWGTCHPARSSTTQASSSSGKAALNSRSTQLITHHPGSFPLAPPHPTPHRLQP